MRPSGNRNFPNNLQESRRTGLDRAERNLADAIFRLQRAGAAEAPGEVRWLKQWLVGKEWATC